MIVGQSCRLALALAVALLAPSLFAGEIVLFEGEDFQGNSITFRGTVPNLDGTRFNDRAASISVRDGTWEVCFDANFQGGCVQLPAGDYPRLEPPFNRSISSLRQIGGADYRGGHDAQAPMAGAIATEIALFDGENLQGDRVVFGDTVPNLDDANFNDRTASISVRGGAWEVCFDAYFQGGCMQLRPGDYSRLEPPFYRSISSVRPLGGGAYGGNLSAPTPPPPVSLGFGLPGVSIGIDLPSYPDLVPIPGYPVYYAPQVSSNYFFYDGMYWVYQQDNWYASSWYNGPWGLVAPDAVPLFVLRVPVGYYRQPPGYFRGWSSDAPPRWGEHWGGNWAQSRLGWDSWNRNVAPAPAPLPTYQRRYSGNKYPAAAQQRTLQSQNYSYQPQDAVVRQHYQTQQGSAPVPRERPPQRGGGAVPHTAPAPNPSPQGVAPAQRVQQSHKGGGEVPKTAPAPTPSPQGVAPAQRAQQSHKGGGEVPKKAPAPTPSPQGVAPAQRAQQSQKGGGEVQRPVAPAPSPPGAASTPRGQPSQRESRDVQKPEPAPTPTQ